MLTGSLYVANSLNSGIAITGNSNTGFVRSLGYDGFESGFPGFLLWSGSALPGQNTKGGVPYSGVGLELYLNTASYFRYSTADDELYVATRNFFLGDPNTVFISGSGGNIEISGSGFHLTAAGDVTASAFLAVTNGTTMLDTNSGFADGRNIGRHIGHQYGVTATVSSTSLTQIGDEYVIYIKDGEDRITLFTHAIINATIVGTVTFDLYIGISAADQSTHNTWLTEETHLFASISATNPTPVQGQFKYATDIPNDFTTDYRKKHVRIRLLTQRTTPLVTGDITLANITLDTGRPLGGSIT